MSRRLNKIHCVTLCIALASLPFAADADEVCLDAKAWPQADQIFRGDPYWLGADGASSVDLGNGRILWLFGDTWIDATGSGQRKNAYMVSNSLAIQSGKDPSQATIKFFWDKSNKAKPEAFFADRGGERLWFGNGVRVKDRLLLFLNRVASTDSGLGFESAGWAAVLVSNPDDDPSAWKIRYLKAPQNPLGVIVGYAAVLKRDGYVYAMGSQDPVKSHPIFTQRWSENDASLGRLQKSQWWAGERLGWVRHASTASRFPLFENGASELGLYFDLASNKYIVVQTVGFGPADVMLRSAEGLTGPWTESARLFRPPEYNRPKVMIYSAKAHPHLTGADLVMTYATNTFDFAEHLSDSDIYYPHFVRAMRCSSE